MEQNDPKSGVAAPPKPLGRLGGLLAGVPSAPEEASRIKKPNEAISLKVKGDLQMGFMHRKLLNVLIRVAQEEKQPGKRLPPAAYSYPPDLLPTLRAYFWAPLEEFVKDTRFDSNDVKALKASLEELQDLKLHSDGAEWLSESPIASVRFATRGGQSTWVGFAFAPETHGLVVRPRQYTEVQLQMQRLLNSGPSLALYERCRQYLTSPGHRTPRAPWSDWYYLLSGQPISKPLPQYKYWNRDTLKRVEAEVNRFTDIRIQRIEYRVGRVVEDLQYEVFPNEQTAISFPGKPPIDTELRQRLIALKIPPERADRLMAEYDDGLLRANLSYTEAAHRRGEIRQKPISYLHAALEKNYAGNIETAKATLAALPAPPPEHYLRDEFLIYRAKQALELFFELEESERNDAVERFLGDTNDLVREQFRRGGLDAPLVKAEFGRHYAQAKWGDPTSDDLLQYANSRLAQRNVGV